MKNLGRIMRAPMEDLRALTLLLQARLESQALSVLYMAIDRAAWVVSSKEEIDKHDFIAWADKFLLANNNVDFTGLDLWAARCGLLHTGAAESRDYRKNGANLIYYKVKAEMTDEEVLKLIDGWLAELGVTPERVRFVDYFWLAQELLQAMQRFEAWLKNEPEVRERAAAKADRQISFQPLPIK
ncbi:hypothetical protein KTQ74_29120 [Pseudomonas chlororaphis]|uniref:hypothetical protein n=1 Tax=Pseudomonas chlororaphis TaxID=587753 RepID=UPI001E45651E|nr:hypothetical protein [Pseudomonas chlororaphis]MCB2255984.1 hypothetical protein [Pseudomonas chlororaphis]